MSDDRNDDRSSAAEARRKILARRAAFVAVALAGVSTAGACDSHPEHPKAPLEGDAGATSSTSSPQSAAPAASSAEQPDAGSPPDPTPQPCLKVAAPESSSAPAAASSPPSPRPPKPHPTPCLKVAPKK